MSYEFVSGSDPKMLPRQLGQCYFGIISYQTERATLPHCETPQQEIYPLNSSPEPLNIMGGWKSLKLCWSCFGD